ncbi:MAG: phage tail tape measure protein, partial [Tissierellia bacterium]|nr:phage tail tape measure protein [Tissierellia bacterium]
MSQEQLSIKILADASSLKSSLGEIKSELDGMKTKFEDTFKSVGKKMSDVGGSLTKKVTLPIVGVGAAASKLGIDFDASMSEVQAVTGATAEEMEVLEKAARDAGATTNKSAKDAADGLKYMGLAGWSVEESQRALMPMLKLSSAGNMELGRTSDLVTDSMSALGLGIDDIDSYLDILAQTSRNSNTDIDALGEAFVQVGGRLNLLGVDTSEAAVALGILGDNGIKGSEA